MSSSDPLDEPRRPASIELSLGLEHQLDNESEPPTPFKPSHDRPQSLDPHVLASIIGQLRDSLASVTKERDDLIALLSSANSREAGLEDAVAAMTEKCERAEEMSAQLRRQHDEDEHNITMLRGQVEQSRRGLMKLQTESRRMSRGPMTLDLFQAGQPSPGGKRNSFTPLTGSSVRTSGHRRGVSITEGAMHASDPTTPRSPGYTFADSMQSQRSPAANKRASGFFGRSSPGRVSPENLDVPSTMVSLGASVEALQRELVSARAELDETRHELTEANEAREASDSCAAALREFIAQNAAGELPPAAAAPLAKAKPVAKRQQTSGSGWGFKLWRADAANAAPAPAPPASAPASIALERTSSSSSSRSGSQAQASAPPPTMAGLNKLQGFFGGKRTSLASSSASSVRREEPLLESSEDEDVVEPISPDVEAARSDVVVHDGMPNSMVQSLDLGTAPTHVKGVAADHGTVPTAI